MAYTSPVFWTFFLLTAITLFIFRRREPQAAAFRVPLYPVVPAAFIVACLYMLYSSINYVRFAVEFGVAVFGGELSGHLVFNRGYLPIDDALYAALRLLDLVARRGGPASALFAAIPETVATAEIKLPCPDGAKFRVVAALVKDLAERHEVTVRGEQVQLPLKEFELLELLLQNAGRVVTRETLIDRVWGTDYVGDTKTLDVHIKRLRQKLEPDPSHPRLIVTVRGLGYKFIDEQ